MSSKGFEFKITKSALYPFLIRPTLPSNPRKVAGFTVAVLIA